MSPYDVTGLRLIHNRPWVKEYNPDVANSDFLVLSGDSTMNNYKHYIAGARLAGFISQGFGWS